MQQTVMHDSIGKIEYNENFWTGKKTLSINDVPLQKISKKDFMLPSGEQVSVCGNYLTGSYLQTATEKNTFDAERNVVRDRTVCTAVSPHFDLGKCSGPLPDRTRGRRGDRRRDQRRAQLYQPVYHQRNKVRLAEDTHFRVYARCYVFDLFSDRAGDPFRRCLSKTIFAF